MGHCVLHNELELVDASLTLAVLLAYNEEILSLLDHVPLHLGGKCSSWVVVSPPGPTPEELLMGRCAVPLTAFN